MSDSNLKNDKHLRVARLESKVNVLLALVVLQSVLLFFMFVSSIIPSAATLVVMLVLAIIAVFMLNSYVPGWAGFTSRMIRSAIRSIKAATRQPKDSVKEDF